MDVEDNSQEIKHVNLTLQKVNSYVTNCFSYFKFFFFCSKSNIFGNKNCKKNVFTKIRVIDCF